MIQDPCEVCRSASTCRLKLNCSRYLRYKEALREQAEDEANLRRCRGVAKTTPEFMSKAFREANKRAAQEHPWRPAEEVMAARSKIEPVRAQQLYAEGLTDLDMAECLGVTRQAVAFWRRGQELKPNRKGVSTAPSEDTTSQVKVFSIDEIEQEETNMNENMTAPAASAADNAIQRIQELLKLRSKDDSPGVRGMFIDLATGLLRDGLMEDETEGVSDNE